MGVLAWELAGVDAGEACCRKNAFSSSWLGLRADVDVGVGVVFGCCGCCGLVALTSKNLARMSTATRKMRDTSMGGHGNRCNSCMLAAKSPSSSCCRTQ